MLAIGLMSGTSLDGVDAALVKFSKQKVVLIDFITIPIPKDLKNRIINNLSKETSNVQEICSLNFEIGHLFCDAIDVLLKKSNKSYQEIKFIASHGQTIWHNPNKMDGYCSSTLQIGEPAVIAYHTNIDVISNFRTMDMAAGGLGAPLVPFADYYLFRSNTKNVALQNIGGIGNVTFLPKSCVLDDVFAFDTGPGNVLSDLAMKLLFNQEYDDGGKVALSGKVIPSLLEKLLSDEYIASIPPKTTGREKYSLSFVQDLLSTVDFNHFTTKDVVTTFSEFTIQSIIKNYELFLPMIDEIIVSGGGSHNQYMMRGLKNKFQNKVKTADEIGYSSDAKEAVAFAILGLQTIKGLPSNVKNATGAKEYCILGQITQAPKMQK